MKVVKVNGTIITEIHTSRKKKDIKIISKGIEVDSDFKGKVGMFYDIDTKELRKATIQDKISSGFCKEDISKGELISKLTADELTGILTKKASDVETEVYWMQGDSNNLDPFFLTKKKLLTEERLEEILTIIDID